MKAEKSTVVCFLRDIGGKADAGVDPDSDPIPDPACRVKSRIG